MALTSSFEATTPYHLPSNYFPFHLSRPMASALPRRKPHGPHSRVRTRSTRLRIRSTRCIYIRREHGIPHSFQTCAHASWAWDWRRLRQQPRRPEINYYYLCLLYAISFCVAHGILTYDRVYACSVLVVDIFAFSLLVAGIARRQRDAPSHNRRGSHIPAPVEISVSHSVQASSFIAPFSPTPSNNFLSTEPQMMRSDKRNRANSSATSTISTVHFAPEPFKPARSRSNTLESATGTQALQSSLTSSSESSWRWIVYDVPARTRMWRIWLKQGLFWVLVIIIAKIGLLVSGSSVKLSDGLSPHFSVHSRFA